MSLFKYIKYSCGKLVEVPSTGKPYKNQIKYGRIVKSARIYILIPTVKIKYAS